MSTLESFLDSRDPFIMYTVNPTIYHPSEEAIAFQANSNLGEKMTAIFEKCIKYRDEHYDRVEDNRIKISQGIADIIRKELKPLWLNELGLDIKSFRINTIESNGTIAIDYHLQDYESTLIGDDIISGKSNLEMMGLSRECSKYIKGLKAVIENSLSFDKLKGKLEKFKWPIELYVDIASLFFSDLYMTKEMVGESSARFTAREITAIYLHEAGHAMIFIERIIYGFAIQSFTDININGFMKNAKSPNDIKAFCTEIIGPLLKRAKTNNDLDSSTQKRIDIIQSVVNKIVSFCDLLISAKEGVSTIFTDGYTDEQVSKFSTEDIQSTDSSIFVYVVQLLISIFKTTIMLSWYLFFQYVAIFKFFGIKNAIFTNFRLFSVLEIMNLLISAITDLEAERSTDHKYMKISDVKGTRHNLYVMERAADEHAVRHGFGGDLATALKKIKYLYTYQSTNKYIQESKMIKTLTDIQDWIIRNFRYGGHSSNYESIDMRIRRVCQNIIAVFKNPDIPGNVRDKYISQMNKSLRILDEFKKKYYSYDACDSIIDTIAELMQPANILRIITSGKLTKEYEAQLNKLENLSNNTLFFSAAQLKSMANKIK